MNADMEGVIQGLGCTLQLSISATSGTSGSLTGEPGPLRQNGTAEPTVVDNEFSVPAIPSGSCSFAGTVNNQLNLPSGSGQNEVVMELYIEFHEEPASEVTGG